MVKWNDENLPTSSLLLLLAHHTTATTKKKGRIGDTDGRPFKRPVGQKFLLLRGMMIMLFQSTAADEVESVTSLEWDISEADERHVVTWTASFAGPNDFGGKAVKAIMTTSFLTCWQNPSESHLPSFCNNLGSFGTTDGGYSRWCMRLTKGTQSKASFKACESDNQNIGRYLLPDNYLFMASVIWPSLVLRRV